MGVYPRMDSVEILMSVSAWEWHGGPMTRIGGPGEGPARTWSGAGLAAGLVLFALVPMTVLHVIGAAVIDPFHTTISDYVGVPGGFALLAVAAAALAVACTALSAALRPAGLPRAVTPANLLVSGAVALVIVALFPTNYPGTPVGVVANVHRMAGAWVFVSLPLAGWLVARRTHEHENWRPSATALTWVSGITAVTSAVFLLSHLPMVVSDSLEIPLQGALERVLYALVMLTLLATARAVRLAVVPAAGGAQHGAAVQRGAVASTPDVGRGIGPGIGRAA